MRPRRRATECHGTRTVDPVVRRASTFLAELESADRGRPKQTLIDDLPLFAVAAKPPPAPEPAAPDPLHAALDALDPDELTPRAAQDALYRLKALRRS